MEEKIEKFNLFIWYFKSKFRAKIIVIFQLGLDPFTWPACIEYDSLIFFIQFINMTLGNNHNTIYGYRTSHVHKVFCLSVSNTKIPFGIYI